MTITVFPLFKIFYERAWYVIVRDCKKSVIHPCRLDRIQDASPIASLTNPTFSGDFNNAVYLINCGWGMTFPRSVQEVKQLAQAPDTVVRFHREVAPYILEGKRRHPFARLQRARDGSGDVLFSIKLLDHWEFKHWVRSFGSSAHFIAPQALVDQERAEVRRIARNYGCDFNQDVAAKSRRKGV